MRLQERIENVLRCVILRRRYVHLPIDTLAKVDFRTSRRPCAHQLLGGGASAIRAFA